MIRDKEIITTVTVEIRHQGFSRMHARRRVAFCDREGLLTIVEEDDTVSCAGELIGRISSGGDNDIIITIVIEVVSKHTGGTELERAFSGPDTVFRCYASGIDQFRLVMKLCGHIC